MRFIAIISAKRELMKSFGCGKSRHMAAHGWKQNYTYKCHGMDNGASQPHNSRKRDSNTQHMAIIRRQEDRAAEMRKSTFSSLQYQSYPMVSGDNPHNYAQNSWYQKHGADAANEIMKQAIEDGLDFNILSFANSFSTFRIADFGCSIGPNAFLAVKNIMESVEKKFQEKFQYNHDYQSLEFQVFFSDHISNDFNTLFRTLPPSRKYFAFGVPGTFHGRLFPKSTLHFVYCSYALHWLSKVPEEVVAKNKSPAGIKDNVYCTGEASQAFSAQFENDMEKFFSARAQELVQGGLMVMIIPGAADATPCSESTFCMIYAVLWSCLQDLAKSGSINKKVVEEFYLPIYYPRAKEVEAVIHKNGCFSIARMVEFPAPIRSLSLTVESATSFLRAITQELIQQHFGKEMVDEIYQRLAHKLSTDNFSIIANASNRNDVDLFILLKRNTKCEY